VSAGSSPKTWKLLGTGIPAEAQLSVDVSAMPLPVQVVTCNSYAGMGFVNFFHNNDVASGCYVIGFRLELSCCRSGRSCRKAR
jgi:hypothetical protein